jgi:hypothetical protein
MIAMTKANVIPHIVLATTAADDVMNVQFPAAIGLRPPADRAAAMQLHPLKQRGLLLLIH